MKVNKWEYIKTFSTGQRLYLLDEETIYSERKDEEIKPYRYVVISDAHTHIERLCFPAYIKEGCSHSDVVNGMAGCLYCDFIHVCGDMTMMIDGGDPTTIMPDEYYLEKITKN